MIADIAVVGGGPAGAAAAITLARAGREVVVVDRARFPRDKFCGDGLTAGALRLLEGLGLDPSAVASWHPVDDVVIRAPSGREVCFPLPSGGGRYAAIARRLDLDAAVLDLARDAGATVLDGHACTDATAPRADRMRLTVDGIGTLDARYAVAADGMWSPMRKYLGVHQAGYRGDWHAFRQYFRDVSPAASRDLHIWFDADLLPGYAWSFPLAGGRANVGLGIHRGAKVSVPAMKALWPELLQRPHIRSILGDAARPEAPHRAWPIPTRIDAVPLTAGRALFVGDAAAAGDIMSGEGIGQALLTGIRAAEALLRTGPDDPHLAATRYQEAVRRDLFADHRASRLLVRGLRHRKGADGALAAAGFNAWTRRNFARWLFEDYPRALVATPGRWHRHMFTSPGAYR